MTARLTDPTTSHDSARAVGPKLSKLQTALLNAIRSLNDSGIVPTANEAAEQAAEKGSHRMETYRKRIKELERLGMVIAVGRRRCPVTGMWANAYLSMEPK